MAVGEWLEKMIKHAEGILKHMGGRKPQNPPDRKKLFRPKTTRQNIENSRDVTIQTNADSKQVAKSQNSRGVTMLH
jgi:hypothetical protein